MANWLAITEGVIAHSRRSWASRHLIAQEASESLTDASALLRLVDESWSELEALNDRLRHAAKRLDQKRNASPLSLQLRESLFEEGNDNVNRETR